MNDNTLELICTRLSHDIVGNIGAVANAVELLEDGDLDFLEDIKLILKSSSQTLSARLKFFRMTFGLENSNIRDNELVKITAQNYLNTLGNKDYPINLLFNVVDSRKIKASLMMLMIVADLLIRGGDITIKEEGAKIVAEISSLLKISADKLEKVKNTLYCSDINPDAGMAPLIVLLKTYPNANTFLSIDDNYIRLIMEN